MTPKLSLFRIFQKTTLGSVDNSTMPCINPRFSVLRCSHTKTYAPLRCSKIKCFCGGLANCQQTLIVQHTPWFAKGIFIVQHIPQLAAGLCTMGRFFDIHVDHGIRFFLNVRFPKGSNVNALLWSPFARTCFAQAKPYRKIKIPRSSVTGIFIFFFLLLNTSTVFAENRVVNLSIDYKTVNFAGKTVEAIAVNNQIPAPTLHFKQGDHVRINVINHLKEGTAIHWHGLLLPWQMDGVEGVTQHPIPPGGIFHYQFVLKQSGTYWYHSHAGFQEQQGVYGAFLIDPPTLPAYKYTKDYAIVLSDWSNTHPQKIYANLKKDGDYYAPKFPLQPSLIRFIQEYRKADPQARASLMDDYKMMQQMRMGIYDISDVAYDTFLLNGQPPTRPWSALVKVGDTVRLRFIGANAGTIFHIKIPGTAVQMISAQGHDIRPYFVDDFTLAPGETYDVLVHIQKNAPYIIYAEAADKTGAALGALVTSPDQMVDYQHVKAFPVPESSTQEMMRYMMQSGGQPMNMRGMKMNMSGMQHAMPMDHTMGMSGMMMHSQMNMDTEKTKNTPATVTTSLGTKYQNMASIVKTNDPTKPVTVIHMALYGYMGRSMWFINDVPEHEAKPIILEPNKRYRIIFANESMMHHPMHIHGHFFILRNGHGAYDPLLHTIDVPPGATIVVDFDADAGGGQWFFHCHFLYHMMSGMSRVFQYSNLLSEVAQNKTAKHMPTANNSDQIQPENVALVEHPMAHPSGLFQATFLDIGHDFFNNAQKVTFNSLLGSDEHKLQLYTEDAEINKGTLTNADADIFYWHLISEFWAIKGGVNYYDRPAEKPYWQPGIGIEGLMPYFIDTNIRGYFHSGSAKLDIQLSRDSQISNNFFIRAGVRSILASKTVVPDEIGSGLNQMRYIVRPYYRLTPNAAVFFEYEHTENYGALKNMLRNSGEATTDNAWTLGFSFLF